MLVQIKSVRSEICMHTSASKCNKVAIKNRTAKIEGFLVFENMAEDGHRMPHYSSIFEILIFSSLHPVVMVTGYANTSCAVAGRLIYVVAITATPPPFPHLCFLVKRDKTEHLVPNNGRSLFSSHLIFGEVGRAQRAVATAQHIVQFLQLTTKQTGPLIHTSHYALYLLLAAESALSVFATRLASLRSTVTWSCFEEKMREKKTCQRRENLQSMRTSACRTSGWRTLGALLLLWGTVSTHSE